MAQTARRQSESVNLQRIATNIEGQIYAMLFPPFTCKSRFCLLIALFQACIFCSIVFGCDRYETLELFAQGSEAVFKTLIFYVTW